MIDKMAIAVVATAAMLLVGCGDKGAEELVKDAKILLAKNEAKDTKEAVVLLKAALQQQTGFGEARFLLGKALLDGGDPVSAEVELLKAREARYPDAEVVPLLARSLLVRGKFAEVVEQFGAKRLDPPARDADLRTTLAIAQATQGKLDAARALVDEALKLDPKLTQAALLKARLVASGGDVPAAQALVDEVIARDPGSAEAHFLKGYILQAVKQDLPGATQAYKAAIAARPTYLPAHARLLDMQMVKGDAAGMQAQLAELKKALPGSAEAAFYELQLAYLKKDYTGARDIAQQLLKAYPEHQGVLRLAGAIEFQLQSFVRAEDYLAKALSRTPDALPIRRVLAQTYLRSGKPQKALDLVAGSTLEASDPALLAVAAEASLQVGDVERAEKLFNRVAKLDPKDVQSRTALALLHATRPGGEESSLQALQALAAADDRTFADLALVGALMQRGRYPDALRAIDVLQKKSKDQAMVAALRGRVHLRQQDGAAARKAFEQALEFNHAYFPAAQALAGLDLELGQREAAVGRFKSVIQADPKNVAARVAMVRLLAGGKDDDKQVPALLAEAIKLDPADPAPRRQLVEYHLRQKDPKQAVAVAREGLAAAPDNMMLLEALGIAQIAANDLNQAVSTFQRLGAVAPKDPFPHVRIAEVHMASRNKPAAFESLKRALQIQPDFIPARGALITLVGTMNNYPDALAFAKTLSRNKATASAGLRLEGDLEGSRKNWGKAEEAYRAGLVLAPQSTELALNLHLTLRQAGKTQEAAKLALQWERDHPNDSVFLASLGDQALIRKEWAAAEMFFDRIVKRRPDNVVALNNLAWSRVMQSKPGAVAPAERAVQLAPGFSPGLDTLALALSGEGKRDKAVELLRQYLANRPGEASLRLRLAKLLVEAGKRDEAKTELDRLAALGDAFPGQKEVARLQKDL